MATKNNLVQAKTTLPIEELLNVAKSRHYLVVRHTPYGIRYYALEHGAKLLVLPGDSIMAVADVKIKPLEVQPPNDVLEHPKVKQLTETVGHPPALKLFQYRFTTCTAKAIQRLETGAEFHEVVCSERAPSLIMHVAHAYYVAYRSNSGRVYSETPGGARAYALLGKKLQTPQVYVHKDGKHRYEIGTRVPIDEEQVKRLMSHLRLA